MFFETFAACAMIVEQPVMPRPGLVSTASSALPTKIQFFQTQEDFYLAHPSIDEPFDLSPVQAVASVHPHPVFPLHVGAGVAAVWDTPFKVFEWPKEETERLSAVIFSLCDY